MGSGVRQGCSLPRFLFNFTAEMMMETAILGCENIGIIICPNRKLFDSAYADDIVLPR